MRHYYLSHGRRCKVRKWLIAKLVLLLLIPASLNPLMGDSADKVITQAKAKVVEITKTEKQILAAIRFEDPLISCLIEHESSFDCKVVGKAGERGCLQFMPSTYIEQCCFKYGYAYDGITNLETQIQCARRLIADGQLWRWSTAKFCRKFAKL